MTLLILLTFKKEIKVLPKIWWSIDWNPSFQLIALPHFLTDSILNSVFSFWCRLGTSCATENEFENCIIIDFINPSLNYETLLKYRLWSHPHFLFTIKNRSDKILKQIYLFYHILVDVFRCRINSLVMDSIKDSSKFEC